MTSRPSSNSVDSSSVSVGADADRGVAALRRCVIGSVEVRTDYTGRFRWTPLTLPLDYSAIERILPHRYPFLLVDRITELEPDKRIVGIKNVSLNERYLSHQPGEPPGAAADDPHRVRRAGRRDPDPVEAGEPREADLLHGHRARALSAARSTPGDVVEIEARVKRLRSRMGQLDGFARVNGRRRGQRNDDVRARPAHRGSAQ